MSSCSRIMPIRLNTHLALHSSVHPGVTFPGLQMIIANWVDDECNSRAISFVYSGMGTPCHTLYGTRRTQ